MPLTFYKCSRCNTAYKTYDKAERCEKSHLSVVSMKETVYSIGAYPVRVILTFADGYEVEYMIDDCSRRRCADGDKTGKDDETGQSAEGD